MWTCGLADMEMKKNKEVYPTFLEFGYYVGKKKLVGEKIKQRK